MHAQAIHIYGKEALRVPGGNQGWRFTAGAQYLVELLRAPELEEFGCRAELVARPDQNEQCDNLGSVFLKFERCLTIHIQKRDFHSL